MLVLSEQELHFSGRWHLSLYNLILYIACCFFLAINYYYLFVLSFVFFLVKSPRFFEIINSFVFSTFSAKSFSTFSRVKINVRNLPGTRPTGPGVVVVVFIVVTVPFIDRRFAHENTRLRLISYPALYMIKLSAERFRDVDGKME